MQVIQIGSLAILTKWLLLGVSILIGLIVMKLRLRNSTNSGTNKRTFDLMSNTLFLGFIIWKLSLFLLDPSLIMKSLFSLLYFTGGSHGLILAITFCIIFFIFKARRLNLPDLLILQVLFTFSFTVLSSYHLLALSFLKENQTGHLLLGVFSVIILSISLIKANVMTQKGIFTFFIIFSFLCFILSIVYRSISTPLFLFSIDQWFFIALIIVSLVYWDRKSFT